jgi:hypothetical protein
MISGVGSVGLTAQPPPHVEKKKKSNIYIDACKRN